MKPSWVEPVALILCAVLTVSCANTVRGIGKDVEETGRAVRDTLD